MTSADGELTTNQPRLGGISDERGLVALGLAARMKTSAPKPNLEHYAPAVLPRGKIGFS